ncbi:DMT family transporter [Microbacteriaceae bacterium K1510]|nr:DMT family transporter [Microbacteriaceae bacterium K1510]
MTVATPTKPRSGLLVGALYGVIAALGWATGFVVAKHGIEAGFAPADLAFHRYVWSGILLAPLAFRAGFIKLGGIGWGRGLIITILAGPLQAMFAYTGFTLVPLGHGAVIQPATAALFGLLAAAVVLKEKLTLPRIVGAATIVVGLIVFGAESLTTIGTHGVGGDLLFAMAGLLWAAFGTVLRQWRIAGTRATTVIGTLTLFIFTPLFAIFHGFDTMLRMGLAENLLQIVVQGVIAGALPIYLFAHSVTLLGAGRAASFPALVPMFALVVGFLALGTVPTWPQIAGLVIVVIGFRLTLK